ncbi:MAG: hypothetical protein Q8P81_03320 [Nanoarchaeota archaeon]|nr:hypothetical protein [Nanoarchaeota archaeon]
MVNRKISISYTVEEKEFHEEMVEIASSKIVLLSNAINRFSREISSSKDIGSSLKILGELCEELSSAELRAKEVSLMMKEYLQVAPLDFIKNDSSK